ncbi:MAG TPA: 3-oxoacyl-[acyl-carrier-protein] synthase III C-terminal domain-containing protein [Myxococcota bacterium]|jgi:alkylresorcinol/alkylpyrone synthase|nr:3-oxoacyl-[acyl-carrier-protein] synthase III C-terminal domain-containing protein [Myxococcota bacterium]
MRVTAVGRAFPENYYSQEALLAALRAYWGARFHNPRRLEQLHRNVLVGGRHLALPIEDYPKLSSFGDANDAFIRCATELGERAVRNALERAELEPRDVRHVFFVSVTGIATPSIDARLVNRLGLRSDVKRTPIFGLGCVAGAAGIARAADYLRAFPDEIAVLLSVELCSLTLQREDLSIPNVIASGLFGDGAAAVVLTGRDVSRPGPQVVATRSVFYPDTESVMGWQIGAGGFRVVLSSDVPTIARGIRKDVDEFLASQGVSLRDVARVIAHPGGPKVLEAFHEALELPEGALDLTWRSLEELGNLSSASVLMVLGDTLANDPPPGTLGLLLAMGPGFCAELVLLRW